MRKAVSNSWEEKRESTRDEQRRRRGSGDKAQLILEYEMIFYI